MKKKSNFLFLFIFLFFTFYISSSFSNNKNIQVYFFYSNKCGYCAKEKEFLTKIKKKYPNIEIQYLNIQNKNSKELYRLLLKKINIQNIVIPITVIQDKYFIGFSNATKENIEAAIKNGQKNSSVLIQDILKENNLTNTSEKIKPPKSIIFPFLGEINIRTLSLPMLSIILGAIDGFNPCAMWALVMLLGFLIGMQNRKKMFFLGFIFIFFSALFYFMFMTAFLNAFLFFSYVKWIKTAIGILAITGGIYYLKTFLFNKKNICKVTSYKNKQKKISKKIFSLTESKKFYLVIFGIILLSFSINLIEIFCSAGLPAIFTQVLSLSSLSFFQYYSYILLYIFIYMLDDLVVFSIALISFEIIGLTSKYSRFSNLIGGMILFFLGILLIFKPTLLSF